MRALFKRRIEARLMDSRLRGNDDNRDAHRLLIL